MKKVSVIIPCYNATKYIDFCMESLVTQTIGFEENIEVIFVNDNSTDSTLGKLLQYELKYPENVIVIPLEQNVKQGMARNIALQYATGQYVDYLDADDYMGKNAYEKLYRIAKQYDADIVEYEWEEVDRHNVFLENPIINKQETYINIKSEKDTERLFLSSLYRRSCAEKFYRREFIIENELRYAEGVYDEESLFTIMAAFCCKRYVMVHERFYYYFQNPEGTCHDKVLDIERRDDNANVWYELLLSMKDRGLLEKYHDLFELIFIQNYLVRSIKYSASRGLELDLASFNKMQEVVAEYFPDAKNNPIGRRAADMAKALSFAGKQLTEEEYEYFKLLARELEA